MARLRLSLLAVGLAACGPSGHGTTTDTGGDTSPPVVVKPIEQTTLAAVGLDPTAMDAKANPCDDFYQFACGGWAASHEIPGDKSRFGRFDEINDRNEEVLHGILEDAHTQVAAGKTTDPVIAAIGTYYGACMDEAAVEKAGTTGIDPLLKVARAVKDRKSLTVAIEALNDATVWVPFDLGAEADFKDATRNIAYLGQGGLGLPDRDYYLKAEMKPKLDAYRDHLVRTFALIGTKPAAAKQAADDVIGLETEIAKISKPRDELRDPTKTYNKIDREGLKKLMPGFAVDEWFKAIGHDDIKDISVDVPDFFAALDKLMDSKPAAWKSYLVYHVVADTAQVLPKRFVDEAFSLTKALSGATEIRVRWKRCAGATDGALGEYLGRPFVDKMFGKEGKDAADSMVREISIAMGTAIDELPWMGAETKAKAKEKLAAVSYLVGYPTKWRDYVITLDPKNYAANAIAAGKLEQKRQLDKVGKPYDRSEWGMTPPTVNAYYNPLANQMAFPAGILQAPFFNAKSAVAVNLGAMGMIVGHELTHGFDDEGAQFDKNGNLNNWFADKDLAAFKERGSCVEKQYGAYQALPGTALNGKLTEGENIADIGGVKLAFHAYRNLRKDAPTRLVADGYTEDQMFYLAVGQAWCSKTRDEESKRRVLTDPHSPPNFRVIGALSDQPDFAAAWSCQKGTKMNPEQSCQVW